LLAIFWKLVDVQHGVIALWQLRELGFSDGTVEQWLGDRLHQVHRAVYAVGRPSLSPQGRWMAAVLACGEGAALSHESAGVLLGLLDSEPARPHVSVPIRRHPQHPGIRVHRRAPMPPVVISDGIAVVAPIFTLLDLAVSRPLGQIESLVNEADRLGLTRIDEAMHQLTELKGRQGVRKLYQVLSGHPRTDSDLERRFLRLVTAAGLPKPMTQVSLLGFRVDFYWPELGLVVETDGLTYHRTPAQQAKDRVRDQQLTAAGLTCLRFTNAQVRREEREVITTLRTVAIRLRAAAVHLPRI
jgi:very-short-patch-repair endonuclease